MKVTKSTKLASSGNLLAPMPYDMQQTLIGKTLNQAIADGSINSMCNDKGAFIVKHNEVDGLFAAIVNNCLVTVSAGVVADIQTNLKTVGDLTFYGGLSRDKYTIDGEVAKDDDETAELRQWFRLGKAPRRNYSDVGFGTDGKEVGEPELELTEEGEEK